MNIIAQMLSTGGEEAKRLAIYSVGQVNF